MGLATELDFWSPRKAGRSRDILISEDKMVLWQNSSPINWHSLTGPESRPSCLIRLRYKIQSVGTWVGRRGSMIM